MVIKINPIFISGNWDKGYALDKHVVSSQYLGVDPFGYDHFDNLRSDIGEQLFQFKYHAQYDVLNNIVDTVVDFISNVYHEIQDVECIIPVPPTNRNRYYQPTYEICKGVAKRLNKYYCEDVLINNSQTESKTLEMSEKAQLNGTITINRKAAHKLSVLVIDDVMKSGTTLMQCVAELKTDPNIDKVYILTITKTKN